MSNFIPEMSSTTSSSANNSNRNSKNILNDNLNGKESESKKREDLTSLGSDDSGK